MFKFWKQQPPRDIAPLLANQTVGAQSVLFSLFTQTLGAPMDAVRRIELTYFALSVLTHVFLRTSKSNQKEQILDHATLQVIQRSLPHSGEQLSQSAAITEYQGRYSEYDSLLRLAAERGFDGHSCTTLLMHAYERVTRHSAQSAMLSISLASPLVAQFIADHIDFVRQKL